MKSILLAALALSAPAFAAERSYSIGDFDRVRVIGPVSVTIVSARGTTAKARGTADALDQIGIEVIDRVLVVEPRLRSVNPGVKSERGPVAVFLATPRLSSARMLGSGSLVIAEMKGLQTELALTGSGSLTVARITADRLNLKISGGGQMRLAGKAANVDADVKGPATLESQALLTADLKLTAASSGSIRMAATRSAAITSSGSGDILVEGKAACTVQNAGSGQIICGVQ
jgi:hypothetical protein